MLIDPTIAEFKEFFLRDFPYGDDINDHVLDSDIVKSNKEAKFNIRKTFFSEQEEYTRAFLYLSAHHLVLSLRNSIQGLNSSFNSVVSSKSVGGVSESYEIPVWLLKTPVYMQLSKTGYGSQYLFMMMPYLIAPIFSVEGATSP